MRNNNSLILRYLQRPIQALSSSSCLCNCRGVTITENSNCSQTQRPFSTTSLVSKKKDIFREEKLPVYDYGKFHPEKKRLYVFGVSGHGALGLAKLLIPQKRRHKQMFFMQRPVRHGFGDTHVIKDIAAGHGFSLFRVKPQADKGGGVIFGCGNNTKSQLGFQPGPDDEPLGCIITVVPLPLPLDKNSKVLAIGAGRGHSLISVQDEGLIALGENTEGQCGRRIIDDEEFLGSKYISRIPRFGSSEDYDVTKIATRFDVNVCLTRMGTVYTFGNNDQGQLGRGKEVLKPWIPGEVQGDLKGEKIKTVVTSGISVLAVTEKGELFGWGSNDCGQVDPSTMSNIYYEPVHIKLPRRIGKIVDAAIGDMFSFILNEYGNVYVWGKGRSLGLGPKTFSVTSPTLMPPPLFGRNEFSPDVAVVKIAASSTYAAAVNSIGDLYTWGQDTKGCLGLGRLKAGFQYFPFRVALGVPVHKVCLGADHAVVLTKASY